MAFVSSRLRGSAAIAVCLMVAACSGSGPVPLEDVGTIGSSNTNVSTSKLAMPLAPVGVNQDATLSYVAPDQPMQTASQGFDYIDTPNLAGLGNSSPTVQQTSVVQTSPTMQATPVVLATPTETHAGSPSSDTNEINMDSQFGFSQPSGQSSAQQLNIAEGNVDEPVVGGIAAGKLTAVNQSAAVEGAPGIGSGNSQNQQVAMLPRATFPAPAPQSAGDVMPTSEVSCRQELRRLGVRFTDIPAIHDSPQCGIDYPVEMQAIGGAKILPAAKLNCRMALTFARWTRNDLMPAAQRRYFSGVKAIRQLSSYSCRRMDSKASNPWSEHARGNALDIGAIVLNDGKEIDVSKPGFFNFRQKGLLNTVRADSCKYFNTVLGPGDAYHGNHFHFDLRYRKSGHRYCSLD